MITVNRNSKIYVHCPAGIVTGGAELLHQLVSILRDNGYDAYVVYHGSKEHRIPNDYLCYNIKIIDTIVDECNNIEVFEEGHFDLAFKKNNTQKVLWWLSVDHFYSCCQDDITISDLFQFSPSLAKHQLLCRSKKLLQGKNSFRASLSIKRLLSLNAVNCYQSEYAQNFLQTKGFKEILALKDFINTEHFGEFSIKNRKDIVLYNPKKGIEFTKKLIALAPEINWVPIQNLTRTQLIDLLKEAKVYIDFGYHPGKDRLPRECAMNGLCIITGMRGSARFFEDVTLPSKYKFDEKKITKESIITTIKDTLRNYETAIDDFALYRKLISQEKKDFEQQVKNLFGF